jgi:hypothetical protein
MRVRDIVTRAKLREEIRRKVARIEVSFEKQVFTGYIPSSGQTVAIITFTNGVKRLVMFSGGQTIIGVMTPKGPAQLHHE